MTNGKMTRAELIRWLGDAIRTETQKPFDEINYEFVEECGCLLDELMGESDTLSEEEVAEMLAKLKPATVFSVRKGVGIKHQKFWKIAVAVAVVLCLSITVMAVPTWRQAILTALRLDIGESVVDEGITYIYNGKVSSYEDINSLLVAENLDILSFEDPERILKINTITTVEDKSKTIITFNDPTIHFHIAHNINYIDEVIKNNSDMLSISDFDIFIFSKNDFGTIEYIAYWYHKNDTYIIKCASDTTLMSILNSINIGE